MSGKRCENCKYRAFQTGTCDYILHTGHPRGCPAGDKCTRYDSGKLRRRFAHNTEIVFDEVPEEAEAFDCPELIEALERDIDER